MTAEDASRAARAPARERGPGLFAGRARELAILRAALDAVFLGNGRLVLLAGEPGIGKTRLAERLGDEAAERGARVLVGRCHEGEGAPAYWPWVMALRELADREPERVRDWLGSGAQVVARVVPELGPGSAAAAAEPELDGESARFRFFDAVATLLGRAAAEHPLVVVLDDLHWADASSLQLLHFAARQLARARVLFVATYRGAEMRRGADLDLRADLVRTGEQIELGGLAAVEVAEVIRSILGGEPRAGVAEHVLDVTAGNPFFVDALVRVWAAAGGTADESAAQLAALRIPEGLHDVLRARLRPLGAEALALLAIAALIGREFAPVAVARVAEATLDAVAAAVAEAERLGLVSPPDGGERRRFAHALVVETLARDFGAVERARVHRRIAQVLEPMARAGSVARDEVAAHYLAAVPAGGAEEAITWARHAAEHALARLGYEDAVRYYRRALEVLDATATTDVARRVDLLLLLGEAERRVGDAGAARATFTRAGALAADAGLADALARAALAYGAGLGGFWDQASGSVDADRVTLVKAALDAMGAEPSGLRAQLLAHLAASLFWSRSRDARATVERLGREAIATADSIGDERVALAVRASTHWTGWGPEDAEGRLRNAEAIVQRAVEQRQPEIELRGRMYSTAHRLELGDVAAADAEVDRFAELAREIHQQRQLWYVHVYRAMRAYMAGRFDEAVRTARAGLELGRLAVPLSAELACGALVTFVRREQGRAAETLSTTREIVRATPGLPVWACALAVDLVATGDLAEARFELDRLAADDFAGIPRDFLWLFALTQLSRACAALADAPRAAALYELLTPYRGRVALAMHGILCDGVVDRSLGLLAATLERWDDAARHFESGIAGNERLGAAIFVTATQHDFAAMLLRRGAPEDVARARELLDRSSRRARELGQTALLRSIAAAGAAPDVREERPVEDACALLREGGEWRLRHGGRDFSIKHTTGLAYLITLLRHPGREVHVLDLMAGDATQTTRSAGDAGEMLDENARSAYRRRLAELADELEEAREFNDLGRTESIQAEIDTLTGELTRAFGLGGRARRAGSDAERARVNVTRALRRAIEAIASRDAAIGSDLERGVQTGIFCSYSPDPRLPLRWEL